MPSLYRTHLTSAPRAVAVAAAVAADAASATFHLVAPVQRASTVRQHRDLLAQAAHVRRRARLGALEPAEAGFGERGSAHVGALSGNCAHLAAHDGRRWSRLLAPSSSALAAAATASRCWLPSNLASQLGRRCSCFLAALASALWFEKA